MLLKVIAEVLQKYKWTKSTKALFHNEQEAGKYCLSSTIIT